MDNEQNKEQNKDEYPDITGVFDIDENDIPDEIIAPVSESVSSQKGYSPILLNNPEQEKLDRAEKKKRKALKKAEKREAKRKKAKKIFITVIVCIAVIFLAVTGIRIAVARAKLPTGVIVEACVSDLENSYETKAVLTSAVTGTGSVKTVAVFSENDYDIYSINKGLNAVVTLENGTSVEGSVTVIEQQKTGDEILSKIMAAFPEGEYSAGVNYVITVETLMSEAVTQDSVCDVKIITAVADDCITLPTSAVHKIDAKYYVWIYKPLSRTAYKQEVSIGVEDDGFTEITKGIKEGQKTVSLFDCEDTELTDEVKIKVKKDEAEK